MKNSCKSVRCEMIFGARLNSEIRNANNKRSNVFVNASELKSSHSSSKILHSSEIGNKMRSRWLVKDWACSILCLSQLKGLKNLIYRRQEIKIWKNCFRISNRLLTRFANKNCRFSNLLVIQRIIIAFSKACSRTSITWP